MLVCKLVFGLNLPFSFSFTSGVFSSCIFFFSRFPVEYLFLFGEVAAQHQALNVPCLCQLKSQLTFSDRLTFTDSRTAPPKRLSYFRLPSLKSPLTSSSSSSHFIKSSLMNVLLGQFLRKCLVFSCFFFFFVSPPCLSLSPPSLFLDLFVWFSRVLFSACPLLL